MYRIENRYHWKTLKHWKTALEFGAVRRKVIADRKEDDIMLDSAVKMLVNNCFPIAIICYQNKEREKEIWMTPLWVEIFNFLEGGRCITKEDQEVCFEEMEEYEQQSILNAWIQSVWLAEE